MAVLRITTVYLGTTKRRFSQHSFFFFTYSQWIDVVYPIIIYILRTNFTVFKLSLIKIMYVVQDVLNYKKVMHI